MAIQDNSWSLEEMNYTLSLVVAVPKGSREVIPRLLRVLLSVMDSWTTCVEIEIQMCTIHGLVGSN